MKYKKFRTIFPPRPKLYNVDMLADLEDTGKYIAQLKLNGTRTVVIIYPDLRIEFYTRQGSKHKAYSLSPEMEASISALNLKEGGFYVFDGELLNNKTTCTKDRLYLYDILVAESEYLYGYTYKERRRLIRKICGNPKELVERKLAYRITKQLWLAKDYKRNFKKLFKRSEKHKIIEGLVIKRVSSKLGFHFNNDKCTWMGKVRRPSSNYRL